MDWIDVANRTLARTSFTLVRDERLAHLGRAAERLRWNEELMSHSLDPETLPRAQLGQDIFVLKATGFRRDGFFVEFGATNGVDLSNTLLLERSFGWHGIVAEPARVWHAALRANRDCTVDTRCVWRSSGETLRFVETPEPEYSTAAALSDQPHHSDKRLALDAYDVATVSLSDLLDEYDAPDRIDYLSIDTEGSELSILEVYDFSREIAVITVEHNYEPGIRDGIRDLLERHGFRRVLLWMSDWDDWYVHRSLTLPPGLA